MILYKIELTTARYDLNQRNYITFHTPHHLFKRVLARVYFCLIGKVKNPILPTLGSDVRAASGNGGACVGSPCCLCTRPMSGSMLVMDWGGVNRYDFTCGIQPIASGVLCCAWDLSVSGSRRGEVLL